MSTMRIYKLTTKDGLYEAFVRAPCVSCARAEATQNGGVGSWRRWGSPNGSFIEALNPGSTEFSEHGPRALLAIREVQK